MSMMNENASANQNNMIPQQTVVDANEGNWFIFHDGENTIQVWNSNLNGKEKVYLNNTLVSEKLSLKKVNTHNFSSADGVNYSVCFRTENPFSGDLKVEILKDGIIIKDYVVHFTEGANFTFKRFLALIVPSMVMVFFVTLLSLPTIVLVLFFIEVMVVHWLTRDFGHIEFLEQ